jgi:hypothetical protein
VTSLRFELRYRITSPSTFPSNTLGLETYVPGVRSYLELGVRSLHMRSQSLDIHVEIGSCNVLVLVTIKSGSTIYLNVHR